MKINTCIISMDTMVEMLAYTVQKLVKDFADEIHMS